MNELLNKLVTIDKCENCNKSNVEGISEMFTEYGGFAEVSGYKELCFDCYDKNTYVNDYDFTFLKLKQKLYCYKPYHFLDFGFRQIKSDDEIERAFNPDRYNFEKWLNERQ